MKSSRDNAITRHEELMWEHGITCSPNRDYLPTGMLYFKDGEDISFMEIASHDPEVIIPILEKALAD